MPLKKSTRVSSSRRKRKAQSQPVLAGRRNNHTRSSISRWAHPVEDEDGLCDSRDFNDREVLGLKGTMSEAELHILRARLQDGKDSKARQGQLSCSGKGPSP